MADGMANPMPTLPPLGVKIALLIRAVSGTLYLQVRRDGNDYVARID